MFSWGNTTQDLLTFSLMALTLILMESTSRHILNTFKDIQQPMANNSLHHGTHLFIYSEITLNLND